MLTAVERLCHESHFCFRDGKIPEIPLLRSDVNSQHVNFCVKSSDITAYANPKPLVCWGADSRSNQLANAANELDFHGMASDGNTRIQYSQLEKSTEWKPISHTATRQEKSFYIRLPICRLLDSDPVTIRGLAALKGPLTILSQLNEGNDAYPLTLMATKKASALQAFITGIVCVVMVGFGWLSDPLIANDQTGALSRLLAWSCLAAAAIALIVAIYFTVRALTIREPERDSDLEFKGDGSGESPEANRFSNH